MTSHIATWFATGIAAYDRQLEQRLLTAQRDIDARLSDSMRHGVLAGGKRLRPYLVIESARMFGLTGAGPETVANALECVHCYSLIHDDLPAMDDDDLRRGKPTVHRAYDEATAILAGDALLTIAFEMLSTPAASPSPEVRNALVSGLARAAGAAGMVGGQMLDLAAEGRFGGSRQPLTEAAIIALQGRKTGALIVFGATAGAVMKAPDDTHAFAALDAYGRALGLAFQIRDDLIDVEIDAVTAGKATGKDGAAGKLTFVRLLGPEGARARLDRETRTGIDALARFGVAADPLRDLLEFNRTRVA